MLIAKSSTPQWQLPQWQVRPATLADLPTVHQQMQQLAEFEGYLTDFRVTEIDLITRGFGSDRQFDLLVASHDGKLGGYAVLVYQQFSYDLTPVATLKELFVAPAYRSTGAGQALFQAVIQTASDFGVRRMDWLVLSNNARAQRFYQHQGGHPSQQWIRYEIDLQSSGSK
jgi:GNAT superfamily N-acetyltransferase